MMTRRRETCPSRAGGSAACEQLRGDDPGTVRVGAPNVGGGLSAVHDGQELAPAGHQLLCIRDSRAVGAAHPAANVETPRMRRSGSGPWIRALTAKLRLIGRRERNSAAPASGRSYSIASA